MDTHTPSSLCLAFLNQHTHLTHHVCKAAHMCTRTHFRCIFTRGLCLVLVHVYMFYVFSMFLGYVNALAFLGRFGNA